MHQCRKLRNKRVRDDRVRENIIQDIWLRGTKSSIPSLATPPKGTEAESERGILYLLDFH